MKLLCADKVCIIQAIIKWSPALINLIYRDGERCTSSKPRVPASATFSGEWHECTVYASISRMRWCWLIAIFETGTSSSSGASRKPLFPIITLFKALLDDPLAVCTAVPKRDCQFILAAMVDWQRGATDRDGFDGAWSRLWRCTTNKAWR